MAGQVYDIEDAVGQSFSEDQTSGHLEITKLQTLDYLRQSLEDLAILAHLLQEHSPDLQNTPIPVEKLCSKLKLKATRNLLLGKDDREFGQLEQSLGDLDLF